VPVGRTARATAAASRARRGTEGPGRKSPWEQRDRREAREGRCSRLGTGGESPGRDAPGHQVLPVKRCGAAREKLRGAGAALQVGDIWAGTGVASSLTAVASGGSPQPRRGGWAPSRPRAFPSLLAMRLNDADSHDPATEPSKLPPSLPVAEEGEGGAESLPRPKGGVKPWPAGSEAFGVGADGERAPGHGSVRLAVPWIFTG